MSKEIHNLMFMCLIKKYNNMKKIKTFKSFNESIDDTFNGDYEEPNMDIEPISYDEGDVNSEEEEIKEPIEVYQKRIQELWDLCDNFHHWQPIKNVAKELGYELKGQLGNKISNQ